MQMTKNLMRLLALLFAVAIATPLLLTAAARAEEPLCARDVGIHTSLTQGSQGCKKDLVHTPFGIKLLSTINACLLLNGLSKDEYATFLLDSVTVYDELVRALGQEKVCRTFEALSRLNDLSVLKDE